MLDPFLRKYVLGDATQTRGNKRRLLEGSGLGLSKLAELGTR